MLSLNEDILIDQSWSHFNNELEGRELDTLLTLLKTDRQTKLDYDLNISIFKSIQLSGKESRKQRLLEKIEKAREIAHADRDWLLLLDQKDEEQKIQVLEVEDQISVDDFMVLYEPSSKMGFIRNRIKQKPYRKKFKLKWFHWVGIILLFIAIGLVIYWLFR